jgi:hypothetical protein
MHEETTSPIHHAEAAEADRNAFLADMPPAPWHTEVRTPALWDPYWTIYQRGEYYQRISAIMTKAGMGAGDVENILANLYTDGFLGGRAQRACENLANALDCKLPEARAVRLRLNGISDQQITRAATIICAFGLQAHQVSLFVRLGEDGVILELVDQVSAQRFDIYPAKK